MFRRVEENLASPEKILIDAFCTGGLRFVNYKFEISRAFLPAKQMGEKRGKFQNVVEMTHKVVVHIFVPVQELCMSFYEVNKTK